MVTRSDKFTIDNYKIEYYSDFLTNFDKNPLTGYMARVTNEESVKQSLKNLVLTQRTERFYNAHIGSKVSGLLFEPIDSVTEQSLESEIRQTIENNEPRVSLLDITVNGNSELNTYFIFIVFSIINIPEQTFNLEFVLKRVR